MSADGVSIGAMKDVCDGLGFKATCVELSPDAVDTIPTPSIVHLKIGHYLVLHAMDEDSVMITDPASGHVRLHKNEFSRDWSGVILSVADPARREYLVGQAGTTPPGRSVKRIVAFAKPYLAWITTIAGLITVSSVIGLAMPIAVMYLIDRLLVTHDSQQLTSIALLLAGMSIGQSVVGVMSGLAYNVIANAVLLDLRSRFIREAQRLSLVDLKRFPMGDLLSRLMNDVSAVQVFLSSASFGLLVNGATAIVLMTTALIVNPRLALIGLAPIPLFIALYAASYRRMGQSSRALQVCQGRITGHAQRILSSLETIKTFCREDLETAVLDQAGVDGWRAAWRVEALQQITSGLGMILASIGPILILTIGGLEVASNRLSLGAIIGVNLLVSKAFEPFAAVTHQYVQWRTASSAADRYFEVIDAASGGVDSPEGRTIRALVGNIAFEKVTVDYGQGAVVKDVSFDIRAGSTVALIGPNGGGKSTLLQLILRHVEPSGGRVTLDGEDLLTYRPFSVRANIAHITHNPMILEGTILDNVRYGRLYASEREVSEVAGITGLSEVISQLPDGMMTRLVEGGKNLSVGQRQRIGLARSLLKRPSVVILDEGTNSLDAQAEDDFLRRARAYLPTATLVIVSHRPWVARRADRILYIEGGRLLGNGTHRALIQSCEPYRRLCAIAQMATGEKLVQKVDIYKSEDKW